ncbi:MAG: hypothetical protein COA58_10750 [Bacteroidetes bacterium]|nr:MAG: hypothetical protein COA58_10750 [Bacteroidota bacterium]
MQNTVVRMLKIIRYTLNNEKSLVLFDQAVFSGNSFIITALLARFLGINGFGVYSSIILGAYLLMSMSNALIIQPMQVAFSKFDHSKSYQGFTLLAQLIICVLVFLLTAILKITSSDAFPFLGTFSLLNAGSLICFWLLYDFFRKLFLASQNVKNTVVVDCIMAGIQLVGILVLGVTQRLTLDTAIILISSSYAVSSLVAFILSKITRKDMVFKQSYFSYHKKEGSMLFLSSLLQWWSSNLFVVTSGVFLGVAALGAFRLVQSMFGVLNMLLQTFENYVLPKAAMLFAVSKDESKKYLRIITKKAALLFAVVLMPLFLFSEQAIYLFGGEDYISYHYVVKAMVVLYMVIYVGYSVRMPIRILTLNRSFFVGYCISFVFSLISFQFLLSNFGITGAVMGLIVNQILMISYWYVKLKKYNFTIWG